MDDGHYRFAVTKQKKRRVWSAEEKRLICGQARLPGVSVSQVARRYDVNANLVFTWLREASQKLTDKIEAPDRFPRDRSPVQAEGAA